MSKSNEKKAVETSAVDQLKNNARTFQRSKIDAKSILLMDLEGKVQEPTQQTITLLGARSQASYRKTQKGGMASSMDALSVDIDAKGNKRFRGENGQVVEVPEVFKCTYGDCTKEFRSSQYLKTHLAYHQSRAIFVCPVAGCGKSFNYRHNLSIHIRVHNDHRPFNCPQNCGKSFRTKGNMMDHLRRHYAMK